MIPLTQKQQVAVLRALLRHYHRLINDPRTAPKVCRMLIFARQYFSDPIILMTVVELLLCFGDWQAVKNNLRGSPRVSRLIAWADKEVA